MELKKYKLGEIANISVGFPFESEKFNTEAKGIRLVRGMNVTERSLRFGDDSRWWSNLADFLTPYYLKKDDIVIGMDGSKVGKNFAIVKEEDLPLLLVQRVACVRAKKDYSQHFLWHYISSSRFMEYVETIKTGSAIPHISGNQIANFPIFVPSLDSQRKITSVLSALDSKIALNRRINTRLEQIAKRLYDYWFVQFDFPNADGKQYKSNGGKMVWNEQLKREIPEGWEVKRLGEVCGFRNGINYDKNEIGDKIYKIVNVRNITASSFFLNQNEFDEICLKSKLADNYIIPENSILIARSGCPGATRVIVNVEDNVIFCGFIICMENFDSIFKFYFTFVLKDLENTSATKTGGSILQNVSQDTLKRLPIVIPPKELIAAFNEKTQPIFNYQLTLSKETAALTALRDRLLPLLMNGQVELA